MKLTSYRDAFSSATWKRHMFVENLIDGAIGGDYLHSHPKSAAYDWPDRCFEFRLRTHPEFEQWREPSSLFLWGFGLLGIIKLPMIENILGVTKQDFMRFFSQASRKTPENVKMTMFCCLAVAQATFARWHADAETRTASGVQRRTLQRLTDLHVDWKWWVPSPPKNSAAHVDRLTGLPNPTQPISHDDSGWFTFPITYP